VQRLVLDVDALVHARRPGLLIEIEALIARLPDRAYIERSVYRRDAARSGLTALLDGWRGTALLHDPLDYRDLPDGDVRFQRIGRHREWKGLSPQDRATLVLATALGDSGVLTCERLLANAVRSNHLVSLDLFDVIRVSLRAGRFSDARAREICAEWDSKQFSAGRPVDYRGSFDEELGFREAYRPLPL
jgi:hypothetical protein